MNMLETFIASGNITLQDLASAKKLIERAELVLKGMEACKKTLLFPFGVTEIRCYSYTDCTKEYEAWGSCTANGTFTCFSSWGGNHIVGKCNLSNFTEVFLAFDNIEFSHNLQRFLLEQIERAGC